MKLGVFTVLYSKKPFRRCSIMSRRRGLRRWRSVREVIRAMPTARLMSCWRTMRNCGYEREFSSRGLIISAFSCHGNPLHPNKRDRVGAHETFMKTLELAHRLGVPVVNTFSGCPGDSEDAKYPNWPVAPWPNEFQEVRPGSGRTRSSPTGGRLGVKRRSAG